MSDKVAPTSHDNVQLQNHRHHHHRNHHHHSQENSKPDISDPRYYDKVLKKVEEEERRMAKKESDTRDEKGSDIHSRREIQVKQLLNLEQRLTLNVGSVLKSISKHEEVKKYGKEFHISYESGIVIAVYLESIVSELFEATISSLKDVKISLKNDMMKKDYTPIRIRDEKKIIEEKENKISLKYVQVSIRSNGELQKLMASNPLLRNISIKLLDHNTIDLLKRIKLYSDEDVDLFKVYQSKRRTNSDNNNESISLIKEFLSTGQILKILNKINPGYSLSTDTNNFIWNLCKELLDLLMRRLVQFINYVITDDIVLNIMNRLLPEKIFEIINNNYYNILKYYKLEGEDEEDIEFQIGVFDGINVKKKYIYNCKRNNSLADCVRSLFIEMGLLKVKDYVNKKDVEDDLKTLKSDYILLYNTLPVSYTSTPEQIGLDVESTIYLVNKKWFEDKRKRDAQRGYILYSDKDNKDDISQYLFQYPIVEKYKRRDDIPDEEDVDDHNDEFEEDDDDDFTDDNKGTVVKKTNQKPQFVHNGRYYHEESTEKQKELYQKRFNDIAKPTSEQLEVLLSYFNNINIQIIKLLQSPDDKTDLDVEPKEMDEIIRNISKLNNQTINNLKKVNENYQKYYVAFAIDKQHKMLNETKQAEMVKEEYEKKEGKEE